MATAGDALQIQVGFADRRRRSEDDGERRGIDGEDAPMAAVGGGDDLGETSTALVIGAQAALGRAVGAHRPPVVPIAAQIVAALDLQLDEAVVREVLQLADVRTELGIVALQARDLLPCRQGRLDATRRFVFARGGEMLLQLPAPEGGSALALILAALDRKDEAIG